MTLVPSFLALVQPLGWTMGAPSFQLFLTILAGWIFAPRRTISDMLVAAGIAGIRHHAAYYRLFSSARWSLDQLGLLVFRILLLPLLDEAQPVKLAMDDVRARKRGQKMFGTGMYYDPLLSTRKKAVVTWGHSWVVLAVVVRLPFCPGRVFSLPILFRLYLNRNAAERARRKYRTQPELAVELLDLLCNAHPQRRFHVFADTTYGGESVLGSLPINCDLTSRLPLNARLYEAPASRKPGQTGRPRKRGAQLPTPAQMLAQRARRVTLAIYGRKDRVRLTETVAHWYSVPNRPLKIVAVEPLIGGRPVQAFYSTRIEQSGEQVLVDYAGRWSIEIDQSWCAPREMVYVPLLLGPVAAIRGLPAAAASPYHGLVAGRRTPSWEHAVLPSRLVAALPRLWPSRPARARCRAQRRQPLELLLVGPDDPDPRRT